MKKRYLRSLYFLKCTETVQNKSGRLLVSILALFAISMLSPNKGYSQFTINEDFKGNSTQGIFLGGTSYLTSGVTDGLLKVNDPENDGWLRLTNAETQKKGFALIEQSFPTGMGFLLDMEFVTWGGDRFADGFSFFLYDSKYVPTNPGPGELLFQIGAPGEALGYSHRNNTLGVTGGYIGVGLDEWGFYGTTEGGKTGGFPNPGRKPNSLAIRGSATGPKPYRTNYEFLGGTENLVTKLNTASFTSLDYKLPTQVRPADNEYYRRIILSIVPTTENGYTQYRVSTKIKVDVNGGFLEALAPFLINEAPPANLNLGFAATTGTYTNIHEVRNVSITTPVGVRVLKKVDKKRAYVGDELKYTIELFNQTDQNLTNSKLSDILPADFQPTSIVFNNNGNPLNSSTYAPGDDLSNITVSLGANDNASFIVTGIITGAPLGGWLTNTATFNANGEVNDPDITNDISTVKTEILDPKLLLEKSGIYIDTNEDNRVNVGDNIEYTFTVTNTGNMKIGDVIITDPLLPGIIITGGPIDLDLGEFRTFTALYAITQANIDNGGVYNQATATGKDRLNKDVVATSVDPNPLDPSDPNYDPRGHTFVPLDGLNVVITNPNIYQKVKGN